MPKRGRKTGLTGLVYLLGPALTLILLLFGGGLFLGLLQALDFSSAAGVGSISFTHFRTVFTDPDFSRSIVLTLYIYPPYRRCWPHRSV